MRPECGVRAGPEAPLVISLQNRIVGHGEEQPQALMANPKNWRKHPRLQHQALESVLERVGWVQGVIVNRRTGLLVDGHLRVALAKRRKEPTIPVSYVDLAEDEEALILATLDPLAGLAEANRERLGSLLDEIEVEDHALRAMLSELAEDAGLDLLAKLDGTLPGVDLDEAPPLPRTPVTRHGDLITLGRHRLLCGDATRAEDLHRLMDGSRADLVFTDPPYNVAYEGKTKDALTITNDAMADESFRVFLLAFYRQALAHTRPGGAIYVCHADTEGLNFRGALAEAGWLLKQCLVWVKQAFVLGRQDYHWQHEPILYGWAPGAPHTWAGDRSQSTVLNFDRPARNDVHPTMKPVDLVAACLLNSSHLGDTVLDSFGGSGSTLIAAEKTGRASRLLELDPRYCDVIVTRWETATGQMATREPLIA